MVLVRQDHQPSRPAGALDRLEQPLRLDREGAGVGVVGSVHEQDRRADLVRVTERRDLVVDPGRFPEAAPLGLEAERRQGAVVGAAAGDPGGEEVRMRQQVRRHEGAVAVAGHGHPGRVDHAEFGEPADMRCRGRADLLDVGVILGLGVADHRHGGIRQHGEPAQHEPGWVGGRQPGEPLAAAAYLTGRIGVAEVLRIRPQHERQPAIALGVVAGGQVQQPGQ